MNTNIKQEMNGNFFTGNLLAEKGFNLFKISQSGRFKVDPRQVDGLSCQLRFGNKFYRVKFTKAAAVKMTEIKNEQGEFLITTDGATGNANFNYSYKLQVKNCKLYSFVKNHNNEFYINHTIIVETENLI